MARFQKKLLFIVCVLTAAAAPFNSFAGSCGSAFQADSQTPRIPDGETLLKRIEGFIRHAPLNDATLIFGSPEMDQVRAGKSLLLFTNAENINDQILGSQGHRAQFEFSLKPITRTSDEKYVSFTAYGDDLFLNGYFFKNGLDRSLTIAELNVRQPWLQWQANQNSYKLNKGNVPAVLLKRWFANVPGNKVTLYRGLTQPHEILILKFMKDLNARQVTLHGETAEKLWRKIFDVWSEGIEASSGEAANARSFTDQIAPLVESIASRLKTADLNSKEARIQLLAEIEKSLFNIGTKTGRRALFFSDDYMTSSAWAGKSNQPLIAVEVDKAWLMSAALNNEIFVGVEGAGLELALDSFSAQSRIYRNWKPKALAKGWNPRAG